VSDYVHEVFVEIKVAVDSTEKSAYRGKPACMSIIYFGGNIVEERLAEASSILIP
jgi:hypothetical protein